MKGKASDICPKCKNCKGTTQESNGVHVWLTEVDCEDPYDGMVKTLDADSDICCSMFEPKPPCEKCERFDGSYCHSPNMPREALEAKILDLFEEKNRLNGIINSLEKEKAAHMKGIERLKKSQEKLQNQVKNLQTTNEESYKREEKLEDKCHKLERRLLEENKRFDRLGTELLMPLTHILYPGEKVCKPYSGILTDIKLLNKGIYDLKEDNKRLADKNKSLEKLYSDIRYALYKDMPLDESISCPRDIPSEVEIIEDLKKSAAESDYYKEKSELLEENLHKAETDITTLNSKVEVLKNKSDKYLNKIINQQSTHYKQCARILELENMVNKLQSGEYDDILAKDIEIKSLQSKYEDAMAGWNDAIDTNDKIIEEKDKQIEELTRRYNMIAKKLNDIHDILKEDPNNE